MTIFSKYMKVIIHVALNIHKFIYLLFKCKDLIHSLFSNYSAEEHCKILNLAQRNLTGQLIQKMGKTSVEKKQHTKQDEQHTIFE